MKKTIHHLSVVMAGIVGLVVGFQLMYYVMGLLSPTEGQEAASIGVIGGADGPTEIFLAGDIASLVRFVLSVVLLVVLVVVAVATREKNKKIITNKAKNNGENGRKE